VNIKSVIGYLCAASLIGGCASMGNVLSGNKSPEPGNPAPANVSDVRGTVQNNDPQQHTLTLTPEAASQSNLRNADRIVLYYDSATTVTYRDQQYTPQDLESGDRIAANAQRQGDRLVARSINVVSDASGRAGSSTEALRDFDATVRNVDVRNHTLELTQNTNQTPIYIEYDSATRVDYQGQSYRPEDLERGDQVHVTRRADSGRNVAQAIQVTRSISGDAGSVNAGRVSGAIRYIDTSAHTIELASVSSAQRFNPAPGGNSIVVSYDSGTVVEYQGRRYGITNLEPGDQVDVDLADPNSSRPVARRIVVTRG
jgi:hypothetical protein